MKRWVFLAFLIGCSAKKHIFDPIVDADFFPDYRRLLTIKKSTFIIKASSRQGN